MGSSGGSGGGNPTKIVSTGPIDNLVSGNFSPFGMGGKSGALGSKDYLGKELDKINPWLKSSKAADQKKKEDAERLEAMMGELKNLYPQYDQADAAYKDQFTDASGKYLDQAGKLVSGYKGKIGELDAMAKQQANSNMATYTNTILPEYKNAMESAKNNASGAMTLQQAQDPNNHLAQQIRALYDKLGQTERMKGQQDYGILSALGAQAAGQQFGAAGNPMTAGQMGQIYAQNQNQAGNAYAAAQKRMYDLQQQGIDRGFEDTKHWYDQGQKAQGAYQNTIKDLQSGENAFYDQQGKFRDEIGGYAGDILGVDSSLNTDRYNIGMTGAGIDKSNAYAGTGRQESLINQQYGGAQTNANNALQTELANNKNQGQFYSALAQMFASGMSDETHKKNISDISDDELDEFLSAVKPKSFEYKDENELGALPGKRAGFMLQDVQGTDLGDEMTFQGPDGALRYDKDNLVGILLAALKREYEKAA